MCRACLHSGDAPRLVGGYYVQHVSRGDIYGFFGKDTWDLVWDAWVMGSMGPNGIKFAKSCMSRAIDIMAGARAVLEPSILVQVLYTALDRDDR
jgi:hypothetical protein